MRSKIFILILIIVFVLAAVFFIRKPLNNYEETLNHNEPLPPQKAENVWIAPDTSSIPAGQHGNLIRYGRELIIHTSKYLGPKGSVANVSNGMNCQNCHLDAGTKTFSNHFAGVASGYPRYRPRSNRVESIEFRVNDCLERSLNGTKIDSLSKEMRAFVAFFKWIGKDVNKGEKIADAAVENLPFMARAADPEKGKLVYDVKCYACHGKNGQGFILPDSTAYIYPPLWGSNSYNNGAGLHRLTRLAGFIKNNMPFGSTYQNPQLSDEEAWDVAAYISSQPRPVKDFKNDWPDMATKPIDHPYGPYANQFSEKQHQYGPFEPIKQANAKNINKP